MTRVYGTGDDETAPTIDPDAVADFFDRRAERIAELGPTRAVIYQDRHPDLAERRDAAEREALLPLLGLDGRQRVLDVGCGTGRWVPSISGISRAYHGLDLTPGLVEFARDEFAVLDNVRFTVSSVDDFSLESLGETAGFDRVLSAGVLIYLNDDQLARSLRCIIACVTGPHPRLLFREPVAQGERLTIAEHFSEDLDAVYNAIYRTRGELLDALAEETRASGLVVLEHGFLFEDDSLNNRRDTRQEWFLVGRPT
jgi:SAM-dependent methyltransferase